MPNRILSIAVVFALALATWGSSPSMEGNASPSEVSITGPNGGASRDGPVLAGATFALDLAPDRDKDRDRDRDKEDDEDDDDIDPSEGTDEKTDSDEKKGSSGKKKGRGKNKDGRKTEVKDPDRDLVRAKLEEFLAPQSFRWLDGDRVSMTFDFREKDEAQTGSFTKPIGSTDRDKFRWTFRQEEFVIGGEPGIRLSDRGIVFLQAVFKNDVTAQMEYRQFVNFHPTRHVAALIYGSPKMALGANFGSQTAFFRRGLKTKPVGKPDAVAFDAVAKIGLTVKPETFNGIRNRRTTKSRKYKGKSYETGQIGILWAGSLAAIVPSLTIEGTIDYEETAKLMKKKRPKSRRR